MKRIWMYLKMYKKECVLAPLFKMLEATFELFVPLVVSAIIDVGIAGADKGYIGQALFENLFLNGIQLVTKVKNNMRNSLMSIADRILLRKRALIETVNDELKNIAQIEHSRHRSFSNFIANSLSAIAAYCFFEKKPAIEVNFINDGQLTIF